MTADAGSGEPGRVVVTWLPATDADDRAIARAAAEFAGVGAAEIRIVRACRSCGSDQHGKPYVLGPRATVHASLSRAGHLAVVAVSDAGPIGVDLEEAGVRATTTPPSEVDIETWVRKESLLKATGHGLMVDPDSIEVTPPGQSPALVSWSAIEPLDGPAWMLSLECHDGFVGVVTVLAPARPLLLAPAAAPED